MSPYQPVPGDGEPKPPQGGSGTISKAWSVIQTERALDEIASICGLDDWTLDELVAEVARLKLAYDDVEAL